MAQFALPVVNGQTPGDRFAHRLASTTGELRAASLDTLQINVGKVCNQACKHCHVDAGPHRTESMDAPTADACLAIVERYKIPVVDITGGAPELNPSFRRMVVRARQLGARVIVRHNFTVMFEPGQNDLPEFFADNAVEVVASLPHYLSEPADRQRGKGVFEKSIAGIRALNRVGYGTGRRDRMLDLMHNPGGAFLPGAQVDLERDFKQALSTRHGVTFDRLFVLVNMPISRFRDWLEHTSQLADYQDALESAFNTATLPGLMCRSMISVSWDGRLFDCDFNQMLEMPVGNGAMTVASFDAETLIARRIATGDHCFGCTAGSGSSCGGALT